MATTEKAFTIMALQFLNSPTDGPEWHLPSLCYFVKNKQTQHFYVLKRYKPLLNVADYFVLFWWSHGRCISILTVLFFLVNCLRKMITRHYETKNNLFNFVRDNTPRDWLMLLKSGANLWEHFLNCQWKTADRKRILVEIKRSYNMRSILPNCM